MMFSMPYEQYVASPEVEDALNLIFILHADHEQNCSTSTVRVVGSSQANLFASCAAAVCALWGPLHGGANVEVLEMLEQIHKGGLSPEQAHRLAKDRRAASASWASATASTRTSTRGPRSSRRPPTRCWPSSASRTRCWTSPASSRRLALADPYFVDRKLYPNVDFYSGIILRAMGIPTNMFTVIFAIGRLPGWIAQWKEQHDDGKRKIARPRQIYIGPTETDYVPIEKR